MRILITGSRHWRDRSFIREALVETLRDTRPEDITVVHGDCRDRFGRPAGADRIADEVARELGMHVDPHPPNPEHGEERFRVRNQEMVDAGADVCWAFADRWASGTGMCARMARRAGIPVVDYGVNTADEDRHAAPR